MTDFERWHRDMACTSYKVCNHYTELTDDIFLLSVDNGYVQRQCDLRGIFNERRNRCQKRFRALFNIRLPVPAVPVVNIFSSSSSFLVADVALVVLSALEVFSPISEPQ